jgi:hypothetical protein
MITLKIIGQEHAWQCKTLFLFKECLSFFVSLVFKNIFQSNMHILILNGHGSHVTLKGIEQAQTFGLDMVILPSHTSHALQPLNVNYFKKKKKHLKRRKITTWLDLIIKNQRKQLKLLVGLTKY